MEKAVKYCSLCHRCNKGLLSEAASADDRSYVRDAMRHEVRILTGVRGDREAVALCERCDYKEPRVANLYESRKSQGRRKRPRSAA